MAKSFWQLECSSADFLGCLKKQRSLPLPLQQLTASMKMTPSLQIVCRSCRCLVELALSRLMLISHSRRLFFLGSGTSGRVILNILRVDFRWLLSLLAWTSYEVRLASDFSYYAICFFMLSMCLIRSSRPCCCRVVVSGGDSFFSSLGSTAFCLDLQSGGFSAILGMVLRQASSSLSSTSAQLLLLTTMSSLKGSLVSILTGYAFSCESSRCDLESMVTLGLITLKEPFLTTFSMGFSSGRLSVSICSFFSMEETKYRLSNSFSCSLGGLISWLTAIFLGVGLLWVGGEGGRLVSSHSTILIIASGSQMMRKAVSSRIYGSSTTELSFLRWPRMMLMFMTSLPVLWSSDSRSLEARAGLWPLQKTEQTSCMSLRPEWKSAACEAQMPSSDSWRVVGRDSMFQIQIIYVTATPLPQPSPPYCPNCQIHSPIIDILAASE